MSLPAPGWVGALGCLTVRPGEGEAPHATGPKMGFTTGTPCLWTQSHRPTVSGGVRKVPSTYPVSSVLLQGMESVKKELDESVLGQTGPYRRPERLRKRKEFAGEKFKEEKVFEPNE